MLETAGGMLVGFILGVSAAVAALIAMRMTLGSTPAAMEYITSGKVRTLAKRATHPETLPDISTAREFLRGYEASAWYGAGVPKNAPVEAQLYFQFESELDLFPQQGFMVGSKEREIGTFAQAAH